jgi:hypothetical protein
MLSTQMVKEYLIIEEVFLTKIAPRMWQNLSLIINARVSLFYMLSKLLQVIEAMFTNKHESSLQTYFAKSFLMLSFQMLL